VSGYLITSEVIDLLYRATSFADCKVLTPEEYLQARHAVDELAQTLTDGTTLPAPDDVPEDPIDAARERYQAAETALGAAKRERNEARVAYVELARRLNPDDARAELAIRIGSDFRRQI
jgi:hypothetical protein